VVDALTKASIKSIVVCLDSATPQTASTLNSSNDIALGALNSEVRVLQSSPLLPGSEQRCVEVLLHAVAFGTSGKLFLARFHIFDYSTLRRRNYHRLMFICSFFYIADMFPQALHYSHH